MFVTELIEFARGTQPCTPPRPGFPSPSFTASSLLEAACVSLAEMIPCCYTALKKSYSVPEELLARGSNDGSIPVVMEVRRLWRSPPKSTTQ
ncbi:hypothetical protein PIB30_006391 [Stylosanthes scabra]|uniref:Uncharacterized protein n=1 Tax=Stylosanthes scabra TaxID=79078 RepID=A0ABU6S4R6_9FABA|nr:hypothetical protein [Stylosanthes scabra]